MRISTTPALPARTVATKSDPPSRPLGGSALGSLQVGGVPYQFGLQGAQNDLLQSADGTTAQVGIKLLRFISKQVAASLHHEKLATGVVNGLWFAFDIKRKLDATHAVPKNKATKALLALGLGAEGAGIFAELFNHRGLGQAAVTVQFVAEQGDKLTRGVVDLSPEDVNAFALDINGEGDVAEFSEVLKALGGEAT
jgi:hypothetical protein